MKWMHLADLHLGKTLNDADLQEDQQDILNKLCMIAEREQVDAVLIAGDIYQRSQPSNEAIAMFDGFLTRIAQNRKVFLISGNHDAAEKVSYLGDMLENNGIYVSKAFDGRLQSHTLSDEYGEIVFHLLPFIRPIQAKRFYPEEEITGSQQAVEAVLRHSPLDAGKRNVLLCHQFIVSAEQSDSEDQELGTLDQIEAGVFDAFDYVALGHIHKPQRIGRESLRYAGSPLKYSFSEIHHRKSVPIVEMREKGNITVRTVGLTPLHEMGKKEGYLNELLRGPKTEDYLWITIHDELVELDAQHRLQQVFPNMLRFSIENSKTRTVTEITDMGKMEEKSPEELFEDFYRLRNGGASMSEDHTRIFRTILSELGGMDE